MLVLKRFLMVKLRWTKSERNRIQKNCGISSVEIWLIHNWERWSTFLPPTYSFFQIATKAHFTGSQSLKIRHGIGRIYIWSIHNPLLVFAILVNGLGDGWLWNQISALVFPSLYSSLQSRLSVLGAVGVTETCECSFPICLSHPSKLHPSLVATRILSLN